MGDLIAYAFAVVSLSDAKFMGGEYLNVSFTTGICAVIYRPKKACLKATLCNSFSLFLAKNT